MNTTVNMGQGCRNDFFPGGGTKIVKVSAKKKVSLKSLKLINDYYCRTVRRRREKIEDYSREMAFSIEHNC